MGLPEITLDSFAVEELAAQALFFAAGCSQSGACRIRSATLRAQHYSIAECRIG
jgi:hypothetical protein